MLKAVSEGSFLVESGEFGIAELENWGKEAVHLEEWYCGSLWKYRAYIYVWINIRRIVGFEEKLDWTKKKYDYQKVGISKILQLVNYKEFLKQLQSVENPVDWGNVHITECVSKRISLNRWWGLSFQLFYGLVDRLFEICRYATG